MIRPIKCSLAQKEEGGTCRPEDSIGAPLGPLGRPRWASLSSRSSRTIMNRPSSSDPFISSTAWDACNTAIVLSHEQLPARSTHTQEPPDTTSLLQTPVEWYYQRAVDATPARIHTGVLPHCTLSTSSIRVSTQLSPRKPFM